MLIRSITTIGQSFRVPVDNNALVLTLPSKECMNQPREPYRWDSSGFSSDKKRQGALEITHPPLSDITRSVVRFFCLTNAGQTPASDDATHYIVLLLNTYIWEQLNPAETDCTRRRDDRVMATT